MTAIRVVLEHFEGSAALLHAAQTEADAERERAVAEEAMEREREAEQQRIQALSHAIADLATSAGETRAAAIGAIGEAIESAVHASLPLLARLGFAAELSLAVKDLVEQHELGAPELVLSPADHDTAVARLAGLEPAHSIQILRDDGLPEGEARLRWQAGGAAISAEDLAAKATVLLTRRLDLLSGRNEAHDR